jgi:hypothetical protein
MRLPFAVAAVLAVAGPAAADVKYPARPESYHVDLRYRIRAATDERVRQFRAMAEYLRGLGFVPDAREESDLDPFDPTAEFLSGTLPSAAAGKLFADPRVQTAVFRPADLRLTADGVVPVRIAISTGLDPADQQTFHRQVVALLGRLGFAENVGYDHRGYTLVRGAMPAGRVPGLVRDLRDQPAGWFLPEIPREQLNLPLRNVLPIRAVEVLRDAGGAEPAPPPAPAGDAPAAAPPASPKLTPEVRAAIADPAAAGKPLVVQLVLDRPIPDGERDLRQLFRFNAPGATIEGVVGAFATVRVPSPADLLTLSSLPDVRSVRLPRAAVDTAAGAVVGDSSIVVAATKASDLHARGYRGAGVRAVVIGTGFPAGAKVLDLTAATSPEVEPAPATGTTGGAVAAAVRAGAPAAEVTLVRVDPTAFDQLAVVARAVLGDADPSPAVRTRIEELTRESAALEGRREVVLDRYRRAFANPSDDEAAAKERADARAEYDRLRADEAAFKGRVDRLTALRTGLAALRGANVIVNPLVWEDGYPVDGLSEPSRLIDERFVRLPVRSGLRSLGLPPLPEWVQAGSDQAGSVWAGPVLDADGNGVLEFAPSPPLLPADAWTPELNFLALRGADGKTAADLPAGAKLRFSIQWREPQDPTVDLPTEPIFDFTLRLLRQVDPSGTTAATDDMIDVARSGGVPVRLLKTTGSGVYERTLEVTLTAAGRYALRLEARQAFVPQLAAQQRHAELTPRVFVRPLDPATVGGGRPVFATFAPTAAGVGVPGDAAAALATSPDAGGRALTGAGPGVLLRPKPDLVVPGVTNAGLAAGYAGGVAAAVYGTGARPRDLTTSLGLKPGDRLVLPPGWLQTLAPGR